MRAKKACDSWVFQATMGSVTRLANHLDVYQKEGIAVNKNELIARVANKTNMSKSAAADAVEATFAEIETALKGGDEVRIVGFGNFVVANRAASTGRNPRTGAVIQIPASRAPKFRPGKALKEAVNR
jgi:DNA-binding protein HU-beta